MTNLESTVIGQINIKIGYNPILGSFDVVNNLQSEYQPTTGEVQSSFGNVSFLHGIQLGVRQRIGSVGIELGWESLTSSKTALSFNPINESFAERSYNHSIKLWSLSLDQYYQPVGFGTVITRSTYSIDRAIGNNEIGISNQSNWGLRLQLNWVIQESNLVSLMIRPYYQFHFNDFDLTGFANDLSIDSDTNESLNYFGLSFVFYNGRH